MEKVSTDVLIEFSANSRQLQGGPSTGDGQLFLRLGLTTLVPAGLAHPRAGPPGKIPPKQVGKEQMFFMWMEDDGLRGQPRELPACDSVQKAD